MSNYVLITFICIIVFNLLSTTCRKITVPPLMGSETLHHLPAVTHPQCDFRWDSHVEGSDPKAHISPHTLLQLWALTGSRGITESPALPVPISAAACAPPPPGQEPSRLSEELRSSCGPCMKRIPNPMPAGLMQS